MASPSRPGLQGDVEHYLEMVRDGCQSLLDTRDLEDIEPLRADMRDCITTLDEHYPEED